MLFRSAFFVAFRVPNLLRSLFAEGSMTMAFVPTFVRVRKEEGDQAAFTLARSIQFWLLVILGGLTLLVVLFPQAMTMLIASSGRPAGRRRLAVSQEVGDELRGDRHTQLVLADAFFVAFRVPNLLRSLFAEGSMTLSFRSNIRLEHQRFCPL